MSLCPESAKRAAMTDPEFWEHVFPQRPRVEFNFEPVDDDPPDPLAIDDTQPCAECGERGACGYDAEGRPMVHVVTEDDEP